VNARLFLLRDAIEDCEVPRELIAKTIGTEVADLAAEVTDDKSLPKEHRKEMQVETAHKKSPRAKVLKLADKTSNLRALATSPADLKSDTEPLHRRTGPCDASLITSPGRERWLQGGTNATRSDCAAQIVKSELLRSQNVISKPVKCPHCVRADTRAGRQARQK
jgi:hypothetical protein